MLRASATRVAASATTNSGPSGFEARSNDQARDLALHTGAGVRFGQRLRREHELEVLERGLDKARSELRVIDLVAEPGMGKSRLLHEFRQQVGRELGVALCARGGCSQSGEPRAHHRPSLLEAETGAHLWADN